MTKQERCLSMVLFLALCVGCAITAARCVFEGRYLLAAAGLTLAIFDAKLFLDALDAKTIDKSEHYEDLP